MEIEGLKVEDVIEIWRVWAEGGGCNRDMEIEGLKVEDVIEIWRVRG